MAFITLDFEHALAPLPFAQCADESGRFGHAFDQDVAGAVECRFRVGDALSGIDELRGFGFGVEHRVGKERFAQRLEAGLARNLRLGPAFWFIGGVKIFQLDLGAGAH